jgi:hypothetical protein
MYIKFLIKKLSPLIPNSMYRNRYDRYRSDRSQSDRINLICYDNKLLLIVHTTFLIRRHQYQK